MSPVDVIKSRLGDRSPDDQTIEYYILEVNQEIKNFCNITEVPESLKFTVINMTVDLILSNRYQANPEELEVVKSVGEGDTQVSYDVRKVPEKKAIDGVIRNYKAQLIRFRRIRW